MSPELVTGRLRPSPPPGLQSLPSHSHSSSVLFVFISYCPPTQCPTPAWSVGVHVNEPINTGLAIPRECLFPPPAAVLQAPAENASPLWTDLPPGLYISFLLPRNSSRYHILLCCGLRIRLQSLGLFSSISV